jgi:hypothetical protein
MSRVLINVGNPRSSDHGETTEFEAAFADGTKELLSCRLDTFAKIIVKLRNFAQAAAKMREGYTARVALVSPFEVNRVTDSAVAQNGMIAIEFGVTEGMPIQLAMTQDMARRTMELLGRSLAQAMDPQSRPRRN